MISSICILIFLYSTSSLNTFYKTIILILLIAILILKNHFFGYMT